MREDSRSPDSVRPGSARIRPPTTAPAVELSSASASATASATASAPISGRSGALLSTLAVALVTALLLSSCKLNSSVFLSDPVWEILTEGVKNSEDEAAGDAGYTRVKTIVIESIDDPEEAISRYIKDSTETVILSPYHSPSAAVFAELMPEKTVVALSRDRTDLPANVLRITSNRVSVMKKAGELTAVLAELEVGSDGTASNVMAAFFTGTRERILEMHGFLEGFKSRLPDGRIVSYEVRRVGRDREVIEFFSNRETGENVIGVVFCSTMNLEIAKHLIAADVPFVTENRLYSGEGPVEALFSVEEDIAGAYEKAITALETGDAIPVDGFLLKGEGMIGIEEESVAIFF